MNELALFAGGGGGIWASLLLGHTVVCAVEIAPGSRRMLLQRQLDGVFPRFPIWDDVRTFNGYEWRGAVDVISGGFPCQDISVAGTGKGLDGERSGLWVEFARIIGEVRPEFAFVENSPMLTSRGLGRVLGDLAEMGFDARWGVLGAAHFGAPHLRERIWILAHNISNRREGAQRCGSHRSARAEAIERCGTVGNPDSERCDWRPRAQQEPHRIGQPANTSSIWDAESERLRPGWAGRTFAPGENGASAYVADAERMRGRQPAGFADGAQGVFCAAERQEGTVGAGSSRADGGRQAWPPEPGVCRVVDELANRINQYGGNE